MVRRKIQWDEWSDEASERRSENKKTSTKEEPKREDETKQPQQQPRIMEYRWSVFLESVILSHLSRGDLNSLYKVSPFAASLSPNDQIHVQMGIITKKVFLWAFAVLFLFGALTTTAAATQSLEFFEPETAEDEGVCTVKCACLDSYIQCHRLNLEAAPGRVPKWAEFL